MSANTITIMTPDEVKKAAVELNNQTKATEFKLVEQVREWFATAKPATYAAINKGIITHTAANDEKYELWVNVKTFNPNKLTSAIPRNRADTIIWYESYAQCELIGEFIKAQGHNVTSAGGRFHQPYGISDTDIACVFSFGSADKNSKK